MRRLVLIEAAQLPPLQVFGGDIALPDYRRYLGSSRGDLFYDARGGLFPNAFAALAGTVCAGHDFHLHLPEHYPQGDPDHLRLLAEGDSPRNCDDFFNRRLRRLIAETSSSAARPTAAPAAPPFDYPQAQVIIGRRGSGKSRFLAEKINALSARGIAPLLVVSPFAGNRHTLDAHIRAPVLRLPPDEALRRLPPAQALFVDEASALAPAQLLALCRHYPCYTLCGSRDGYEGSAGNFLLKTLPALGLSAAQIYEFNTVYRYQADDSLDSLMQALFLFSPSEAPLADKQLYRIRQLSRAQLFANEALLRSIWALLSRAHYRSRPEDMKRLLDLPDQALFVGENATGEVLGLVQIILESPLPPALAAEIAAGRRRPRGRLLMQQLLIKSGDTRWAAQPVARIQRIAVHQECRRQGLASALLRYAEGALPAHRFGTVHSHSPELEDFWRHNGYPVRYRALAARSRHHGSSLIRIREIKQ